MTSASMPLTMPNLNSPQTGTAALLTPAGLDTVAAAPATVGTTIIVERTTDDDGIVLMRTTDDTTFGDDTTGLTLIWLLDVVPTASGEPEDEKELAEGTIVLMLETIIEEEDTMSGAEEPTNADVTTAVVLTVVVVSSVVDAKVTESGGMYIWDANAVVELSVDIESGVADWVELEVAGESIGCDALEVARVDIETNVGVCDKYRVVEKSIASVAAGEKIARISAPLIEV